MSLSMSMSIYVAHKRETSNALYALVRSKHKRFQMLPKRISVNSSITQVAFSSSDWEVVRLSRPPWLCVWILPSQKACRSWLVSVQVGEDSVCCEATTQRDRVPDVRGVPVHVPRSVREPQVPSRSLPHAQEGYSDRICETPGVWRIHQRSVFSSSTLG